MKASILYVLLVCSVSISTFGQLNSFEGYYYNGQKEGVLLKEDIHSTILHFDHPANVEKGISANVGGVKQRIPTTTVKGFKVEDDYWISVLTPNGTRFCRVKIDGAIKFIYLYHKKEEDTAPLSRGTQLKSVAYLQLPNGEVKAWGAVVMGFKKKFAAIVSDNAEMSKKVAEKQDGYKSRNHKELIIEYNEWYKTQHPEFKSFSEQFVASKKELVVKKEEPKKEEINLEKKLIETEDLEAFKSILEKDSSLANKKLEHAKWEYSLSYFLNKDLGLGFIKALVEKGAKPNHSVESFGKVKFDIIINYIEKVTDSHPDLVAIPEYLLNNGAKIEPHCLKVVIMNKNLSEDNILELVKLLIKNGADKNEKDMYGIIPESIASGHGYTKIVAILK